MEVGNKYKILDVDCLNPYSNGMLTWRRLLTVLSSAKKVLILILMECSLGNMSNDERTDNGVCLNPYSNGMLTWTPKTGGIQ